MQSAKKAFEQASPLPDSLPWADLFLSPEFSDIVSVRTKGVDCTKEKVILFDIDGVCVKMKDLFYDFLHKEKGLPFIPHEDREHYITFKNYERLHPELLSAEQECAYMNEFSARFEYFGNLPETDGAREALKQLRDLGYKFVAVTAALCNIDKGTEPDMVSSIVMNRIHNLRSLFGEDAFVSYHFVFDDLDKNRVLERYKPTYFIDDSVSNCIRAQDTGHHAIIFTSEYYHPTSNIDNQPVVSCLREFSHYVEYNQNVVVQQKKRSLSLTF